MVLLLQYTLIFASVLVLVALGGCFSEHSGVINIGLEGIMVMGALGGALAMKFLGIQQSFAYFYGGTSLLIMVGVVLDTLKQIESYLLMRHYDGLMKTGRIQGRH